MRPGETVRGRGFPSATLLRASRNDAANATAVHAGRSITQCVLHVAAGSSRYGQQALVLRLADDVLCLLTSLVTALDSGLKTRRIFFPVFYDKAEDLRQRCGSQRDATVGGAVIEAQLI